VVTVPAGTPLVYRVGQPWGNQVHVPTLEGHRWLLEPGMPGSEQVFNDVLLPGMSLDLHFVGGAGGDIQAPGDYLFLDRRQPFLEAGLWNILRVTGDGTATSGDRILITEAAVAPSAAGSEVTLSGIVGIRPAGDTVESVTLHAGPAVDGRCQGPAIGRATVDPGSGHFQARQEVPQLPDELCVQSPAGGVASKLMGR
jgi:hypothetical protein